MAHFGKFLEQLLDDLGVKPRALAEATDNTERNVYRWLDRETPPGGSALERIAAALRIPFEEFKPASEGLNELPAEYRDRRRFWQAVRESKAEAAASVGRPRSQPDDGTLGLVIEMTESERRRVDALAVEWGVSIEVAAIRLIEEALKVRYERRAAAQRLDPAKVAAAAQDVRDTIAAEQQRVAEKAKQQAQENGKKDQEHQGKGRKVG